MEIKDVINLLQKRAQELDKKARQTPSGTDYAIARAKADECFVCTQVIIQLDRNPSK